MLAFILRRLLQAVIVMVTVAFLAFLLFQFVGDCRGPMNLKKAVSQPPRADFEAPKAAKVV